MTVLIVRRGLQGNRGLTGLAAPASITVANNIEAVTAVAAVADLLADAPANAVTASEAAEEAVAAAASIGGFDLSGAQAANDVIMWDTGLTKFVRRTIGNLTSLLGLSSYALINSPTFTGSPAAPTPSVADNSTRLATTAFVKAQAGSSNTMEFRLSLSSGIPVTTADVIGATTIYCVPHKGNSIKLYDGTNWNIRTSAQFSLALGTLTSGRPYDVFCYDNSGTPTLEFTAWTNDTTRATALAYQDGVLVKSGTATRRYLGTFYTTSTTTTEDSLLKRDLYNYYHRARRLMLRNDGTTTWNYTTATWRQANGSSSNQLEAVQGVAEDSVNFDVQANATNGSSNVTAAVAIGLDSTTSPSGYSYGQSVIASRSMQISASYKGTPSAGRHTYAWLEISEAAGTTTWNSNTTVSGIPVISGMSGEVFA